MANEREQKSVIVYNCPQTETNTFGPSEKPFADEFGFKIFEATTNGDCFFHSLEEYGRKKNYEPLHKNRTELRSVLVSFLLRDPIIRDFITTGVFSEKDINIIKKPTEYTCKACDLVQAFSHKAFTINLYIYKLNYDAKNERNYVTFQKFMSPVPSTHTVCMLYTSASGKSKVNNHYKLLESDFTTAQLDKIINDHTKESSLERNLRKIKELENESKESSFGNLRKNKGLENEKRKTRKNRSAANARSKSKSRSRSRSRNDLTKMKEKRNIIKRQLASIAVAIQNGNTSENTIKEYNRLKIEYATIKNYVYMLKGGKSPSFFLRKSLI